MMEDGTMKRREFLRQAGLGAALLTLGRRTFPAAPAAARPLNLLLITADDMWWHTPGCFGGKIADLTPNIDRLAGEGMRFTNAHVTVAVCQPSRSVMMTGRYPHHNGAEGFEPVRSDVPTLTEQLHNAGYLNGILGKVVHLLPKPKFFWDMEHDQGELGNGRNPDLYYQYCKDLFTRAATEKKPFFLMANSHDPHRPFWSGDPAIDQPEAHNPPAKPPSRLFKPEEVPVPGFLPDLPEVRREQAEYTNSARRCDDTIGMILRALKESGAEENTLVMFLSDNGISMPFAKSNCYLNSTRTPWIVRWPGKVKAGGVDRDHFIAGIDLTPTFLDAAGLGPIAGVDGRSFVPLLLGQDQVERDSVFTQYHRTSGENAYPMRCVQDKKYGYIFNFWSDGQRVYKAEPLGGRTFPAMRAAAGDNPAVAARVKMVQYRAPEEFYDLENDPDALHNLAGDPKYKTELERFRKLMESYLEKTGDRALEAYRNRTSPEALAKFMDEENAKAGQKVAGRAGGKKKGGKKKAGGKKGKKANTVQ